MTALHAVVLALAVYRLTVLVTKDYIAEPVRVFLRRQGRHGEYLSSCPWCCSFWMGVVVVPLTLAVGWWWEVDLVFACSAVAAVIFERVNR